ncbi:MAG: glycosyltransferase, partial [Isosphaeraceae bacterium]|nr:glycosyltransferase [Isosphaeraceae bacterium]
AGICLNHTAFPPPARPRGARVVGLIGSFGWHPTYSAGLRLLTRLWPEIKRRVPAARLQIVGRKARSALSPWAAGPDISLCENVPDTIPYFRSTDVLLYAPARGSGMKVKTLEAFALGTPVVTTSEGVEGLPAEDGVHAGLSEDDAGLIERTVALLEDPARRDRQRRAARALLESYCRPDPVLDRLEQVYATLSGRSNPRDLG